MRQLARQEADCPLTGVLRHGRNVFGEEQHSDGLGVVALRRGPQLQQLVQVVHPRICERLGARRQQPGRRLKLCQQAGIPLNQARVCLHRFKQFQQWRAMVGL